MDNCPVVVPTSIPVPLRPQTEGAALALPEIGPVHTAERGQTSGPASPTATSDPAATTPKPLKPKKQVNRKTKAGRLVADIHQSELQAWFQLPEHQACQRMGMGLTVFKRVCRRFGIRRWPYRKLQRLKHVLKKVEAGFATDANFKSVQAIIKALGSSLSPMCWGLVAGSIVQACRGLPQEEKLIAAVAQGMHHSMDVQALEPARDEDAGDDDDDDAAAGGDDLRNPSLPSGTQGSPSAAPATAANEHGSGNSAATCMMAFGGPSFSLSGPPPCNNEAAARQWMMHAQQHVEEAAAHAAAGAGTNGAAAGNPTASPFAGMPSGSGWPVPQPMQQQQQAEEADRSSLDILLAAAEQQAKQQQQQGSAGPATVHKRQQPQDQELAPAGPGRAWKSASVPVTSSAAALTAAGFAPYAAASAAASQRPGMWKTASHDVAMRPAAGDAGCGAPRARMWKTASHDVAATGGGPSGSSPADAMRAWKAASFDAYQQQAAASAQGGTGGLAPASRPGPGLWATRSYDTARSSSVGGDGPTPTPGFDSGAGTPVHGNHHFPHASIDSGPSVKAWLAAQAASAGLPSKAMAVPCSADAMHAAAMHAAAMRAAAPDMTAEQLSAMLAPKLSLRNASLPPASGPIATGPMLQQQQTSGPGTGPGPNEATHAMLAEAMARLHQQQHEQQRLQQQQHAQQHAQQQQQQQQPPLAAQAAAAAMHSSASNEALQTLVMAGLQNSLAETQRWMSLAAAMPSGAAAPAAAAMHGIRSSSMPSGPPVTSVVGNGAGAPQMGAGAGADPSGMMALAALMGRGRMP